MKICFSARIVLIISVLLLPAIARADLVGGPYVIAPLDVNGGGARSTSLDYALVASTGQHGGVRILTSADYQLDDGFHPPALSPDCNNNGVADEEDILLGTSQDCQSDGIPDDCQLGGTVTLLTEDFELGLPAGWAASGLWHTTNLCPVPTACNPVQWAYFGQDIGCDFDTAAQATGVLTATNVAIPADATTATLSYCSAYDGERGAAPTGFDAAWITANGQIVDDVGFTTTLLGQWEPRNVDLSAFAGQTVTLAWHFDSIDAINNARLGWQIDQISLAAVTDNDCNANGIPDECDITAATSTDVNANGVPDECEPDVRIAAVPVVLDPTTTTAVRGAEPTPTTSINRGATYWIEIWASDLGTNNTGLTSVYADLAFCAETSATSVNHGSIFTTLTSGTILTGAVDEFGGSALPSGGGIAPQWVRIGWAEMTADLEAASCAVTLSPAAFGVAALGRGTIPPELVDFGSATIAITQPSVTYDLDGSGFIDVGDLSLFAASWLQTVPPGNPAHDFDCDGFVGPADLSWFATGWQKFTTDPTILFAPTCPAGALFNSADLLAVTDVDFRLLLLAAPSVFETTATLPTSITTLTSGQAFVAEVWVSDVGATNTGVVSAYVDFSYPVDAASVTGISHGGLFTAFNSGLSLPGIIDELGGSALPGTDGIEPQWARVAVVQMQATASPASMTFSLTAGASSVSAHGRGAIATGSVSLDSVSVPTPGLVGDIDGDGDVDLVDGDALVAVLLGAPLDPAHVDRSDLNGDGNQNGADIQPFVGAILAP